MSQIWNTAKKAGKKVATMMWVGSSVNVQGTIYNTIFVYQKADKTQREYRNERIKQWTSVGDEFAPL